MSRRTAASREDGQSQDVERWTNGGMGGRRCGVEEGRGFSKKRAAAMKAARPGLLRRAVFCQAAGWRHTRCVPCTWSFRLLPNITHIFRRFPAACIPRNRLPRRCSS